MTETLDNALEKIHSARAAIRSEIESIKGEIARLEQENRTLPDQTASFGEIKKGVLDLVASAGARYAETYIRASIIDFAKGAYRDMGSLSKYGQPLSLGELDAAVKGKSFPMANSPFLTGGNADKANDLVLYAISHAAVQEVLSRLMETLTPADFGLRESPRDEEMSRAEMNERIAANLAQIDNLRERKAVLESELKKLS